MTTKTETTPVVKEVLLNAHVETVWSAITNKNEMKQWYFDIAEFKPEVGFEFQFYGDVENRKYVHLCKVTEVIPNRKLTYSWKYEGHPGNSFVTFELFDQGDKTRLRLIHEGLETFPSDNPDFDKENFDEGWNEIIGTYLKDYVEKQTVRVSRN